MSQDRYKDITIQQMESLIRLVEERSFSNAARRMLLTQPALTKHIKNMEEALGVRVVNRSNAGLTLTAEGKIVYEYARKMIRLRNEVREKIIKTERIEPCRMYIAASTIPATYILPEILSRFKGVRPDIRAYVKPADSEEVLEMILDRQAEIGFIGKRPVSSRLQVQSLWKDRLVLVAPKNHRWRKAGPASLEELSNEPFIIREKGSATRDAVERYLEESKGESLSRFNIACEFGSSEAVKEAVIAGLGVSIISVHAVKRELKQGLLFEVPLQDCSIERYFYLIYRKHFDLMACHELFIDFVEKYRIDGRG
ncbi:MAG: selenium metabolism-associated LysR family transcriptional regulator [Syntrophales bacterium]